MLGDLAEPFFAHSRWLIGATHEVPEAVVLVYTGLSTPVLLSYGAPDVVSAILNRYPDVLGAPCYAKIPLEHREQFSAHARLESAEPLWVMGLTAAELRAPQPAPHVERITRATPEEELTRLYADYPGHFFEPGQLDSGLYFGIRTGGELVCIAGTHVLAPAQGVAVLGNIATAARVRGRGLARACTGALAAALFNQGCRVLALQVSADNAPAIAAYRSLGFRFHGIVLQSRCVPP